MRQHWSQDRYIEAYWFAVGAHRNQTVPGTDLPYIVHPTLVSMEVIAALDMEPGRDEDLAVQCALLHDVIEDGEVSYEKIKSDFEEPVANGVLALSKDESLAKDLQLKDSLMRIRRRAHGRYGWLSWQTGSLTYGRHRISGRVKRLKFTGKRQSRFMRL